MGEISDVGASDPPHLRGERCQASRRAEAAAARQPLGPPVPCPFHQGPTGPAWQGHCPWSGNRVLGPWALTQLPAMQGEVFGPPFGQSREAFPPRPHSTWGWAHGAHTGTHKHRSLPPGRWAPYMQTMLNMQLWGPPWGPFAPPTLGDGPPAVAGLRLLGYDPIPDLWLINPSSPLPAWGLFLPCLPKGSAWAFLPICICPLPGAPSSCQCSLPSGPRHL